VRPALLNLLLPTLTHTHVPRDVYPQNIPTEKLLKKVLGYLSIELQKDKKEEPHSAAIVLLLRG
jgi:hypothetical protein